MRFFVVVEFTKSGPRVIYEGPSERNAQDVYSTLEHGTIQSREGETGHARDGSVMIRSELK